jgi:hypothetical protein
MQANKRRRVQRAVIFVDDNLRSILEFLPLEYHVAFALVSKQFHHAFCTSTNVVHSKIRELTECLSSITNSEQLLLIDVMTKKLNYVKPSLQLKYANTNLYKKMKRVFGRSEIIEWKPFLAHLEVKSINCTGESHRVVLHFKGNDISLHYEGEDYTSFVVLKSTIPVITISNGEEGERCEISAKSFDNLPMKESYKISAWIDLFLMLADFFINERGFPTSKRKIIDFMIFKDIVDDYNEDYDEDDEEEEEDVYSTEIDLNQHTDQVRW